MTVRDLSLAFVGSGADVLVMENSDQPGGRIFCDQVLCGGNEASKRCDIAILVDGVEHSDVTYLNGGWGEFTRGGVVVKGGPVRKFGGQTNGQVSLLLGALGNNEYRLLDVQDGGRALACGFRDETPKAGTLLDLGPDSTGAISVMGMSWVATPSTTQPDEKAVLEMLAQIRALRVEAPLARAAGVTDVKLHRVLVRASHGSLPSALDYFSNMLASPPSTEPSPLLLPPADGA